MEKVIDDILVIKIGTNTLIKKQIDGSEVLDTAAICRIAGQIIELREKGHHIVVVSSAAITAGMVATGLKARPCKKEGVSELQRLASIGWRHVLNAWDDALEHLIVGEILLTKHELELRSEREEALRVISELTLHGNIPVINENDAITHAEINFGDNDTLAATLAAKIRHSELFGNSVRLIILSDVDGVYHDPTDPSTIIRQIGNIEDYSHIAFDTSKENGTGGMITKFAAARISIGNHLEMYIANGKESNVLPKVLKGEIGTRFTIR